MQKPDPLRPPVDGAILAGVGLCAGGIAVVAPWEVATAAGLVLALAFRGRARAAAAGVLAIALGMGFVRARASIRRHETESARADVLLPFPARCSARAQVDSSPVLVRGTVRWDGQLDASCDDASVEWTGRATLYGGPDDLARGDEVDIVATLAP